MSVVRSRFQPPGTMQARGPRILPPALASLLLVAVLNLGRASAEPPPLIPRTTLFAPAVHGAPMLSPDGERVAWLGLTNRVPAIWIRSVATNDTRLISPHARGPIRPPVWQSDGQALLYLQETDAQGTEHLMQAHIGTGTVRDLTPFLGVQARLLATSPRNLDQILVTLNLRDRRLVDVFRVDVRTGALALEAENSGEISDWHADADLRVRLAQIILPNGDLALSTRADPRSVWRPILRWGPDDAAGKVAGFGPGGSNVWLITSVGSPAPSLIDVTLDTGKARIVAKDPRFDVVGAAFHPYSNTLEAVQFQRARAQWQVAYTNFATDLAELRKFRDADVDLLSQDLANRLWSVSFTRDTSPVLFALYRRDRREVIPLFSERPALEGAPLAPSRPVSFKARDGLALEGYLTLPPGVDPKALPTVVLVHGGPWSRIGWGMQPDVQWLANRGYAVVQVNYRGSTGYGKDHFLAGDKEWGGKILLDLLDAREWAVAQGYADASRVAIMGAGFGGYAAMAALALHPGAFAAGISESGPIDLVTMLQAVPAGSAGMRAALDRRVGNPTQDLALLRAQSPATAPEKIQAPLLAAITPHDPDLPVTAMDTFVAALRRNSRQVEYLYFADEGTAIRSPSARLRYHAAVEAFLARHLGGRAEAPTAAEAFETLRR